MSLDLLEQYYRVRVNDLAQKKRRSGEKCRDKDFVFPALRRLEKIAEGGEGVFFDDNYVVSLGMTRGDYDTYSAYTIAAMLAYAVASKDVLIERLNE